MNKSEIQLAKAAAEIARIYLELTGCSLPEDGSWKEIGDTIIERIKELRRPTDGSTADHNR